MSSSSGECVPSEQERESKHREDEKIEGTDVFRRPNSVDIKNKRVYSFDELDDEPHVELKKFRRINSSRTVNRLQNLQETKDKISNKVNKDCDTVDQENILALSACVTKAELDEKAEKLLEVSESAADSGLDHTCSSHSMPTQEHCDMSVWSAQHEEDSSEHRSRAVQDPDSCHKIVYIHSDQLIQHCNQLPRIADRAGLVHSLIEALGLLNFLVVVPAKQIEEEEIRKFHSADYIEFLQRINRQDDEEKIDPEEAEQYGLTYDCPVRKGVYDCAALVAGATVTAAASLCEGQCRVAINWCGGWHHAQRSEASGFCYINDIVLGILKLREKFSRVLYIDLDLHHGDGVENAFSTTAHVLTVSFHKYDAGFFPGSGNVNDVGSRGGKYYSVNVPLKDGICDDQFVSVFKRVMTSVRESYDPEVVVCQCGADGLAGDPMSSFNLTLTAYRHCLYFLMGWKLPILLLGGGGYHHANTARCWASLTALTVGRKLLQDVPDHKHFTEYGPDYELTVLAGNRKNHNSLHDLINTCRTVTENMQKIKERPL